MNSDRRRSRILTMVFAAGLAGFSVPRAAAQPAVPAARTFASPQEAVSALRSALKAEDKDALRIIFGPDFRDLLTGDEKQDRANARRFSKILDGNVNALAEGDDRVVLEIGTDKWPFPIPLIKQNSLWRFDTAAGKQEIVDRHVGKDELHAIGVCESYVPAQKQYVTAGRGASGSIDYALKFKSAPGKRDGLYWPTTDDTRSPLGSRIAEADVAGASPKPFHGYFFRIMTRQGAASPGGARDYVKDGGLTGGFALVAYPEHWGRSGIMTFIVNQDGNIYQRDLGEKTSETASIMTEYDPSDAWTLVKDKGVFEK